MNGWGHLITKIYRLLLAFYPAGFRIEFSEEMESVFTIALKEVQLRGWGQPWQLLWREIRDWPGSVLQEHLRDRRSAVSLETSFMNRPFVIWIVMNILGFGALGVSVLLFPSIMSTSGFLGTILIISIPISFAQWIALRRIFPVSIFWILSIPISLLFFELFLREIPNSIWPFVDDESVMALTAGSFVIGLLVGIPQGLILRRQFTNSSIWLLGSSVGTAAGFWLVLATDLINQSPIVSYIVAVIVYAIVTGFILSRLFAKQQTNVVKAA